MNSGKTLFSLTKKVARDLDLIETVCVNRSKNAKHLMLQPFHFLIVIDFESTCWEHNVDGKQPEIIEFPAVLLNVRTGMIEEEFQQFVMPVEYPILSDFCVKFTGIKQEVVENGVPLHTCISLFCSWIKEISEKKGLVFHVDQTGSNVENTCTFVTWSDWDLAVCLHNECTRKQLYKPEILCQWIDLRATYRVMTPCRVVCGYHYFRGQSPSSETFLGYIVVRLPDYVVAEPRRPQHFTRDGRKVSKVHYPNLVYSLRAGNIQVYVTPVILPSLLGAWCRMEQFSKLPKISRETDTHLEGLLFRSTYNDEVKCKRDSLETESVKRVTQPTVTKKMPRLPLKQMNIRLTQGKSNICDATAVPFVVNV